MPRNIQISKYLLLLSLLVVASNARAFTKTQVAHIAAGCTVSPCVVALTATGTNHLLAVGMTGNIPTTTLGAPPAAACNGSWIHAPNAPATSATNVDDAYYCLNSASGITSFSQPVAGISSGTVDITVWEATPTLSTVAFDSDGKITDSTCTSCAGVALTLSGNSDFIIVLSGGSGIVSGLTGAGFTLDGITNFGDGFGSAMTTGSLTAPTTWTTTSGTQEAYALAFQETGGANVSGRQSRL
jgi:hypothetical protein